MSDERVFLSFDEAVKMLPDGEYIHTFRNPAVGLVFGSDHDRTELLEKMKKSVLELSGEAATAMKHGLCLIDETGPLFIATKTKES